MMDKKTIIVVIVCMATLILWQRIIDKLYPPTPKSVRIVATNATESTVRQTYRP